MEKPIERKPQTYCGCGAKKASNSRYCIDCKVLSITKRKSESNQRRAEKSADRKRIARGKA